MQQLNYFVESNTKTVKGDMYIFVDVTNQTLDTYNIVVGQPLFGLAYLANYLEANWKKMLTFCARPLCGAQAAALGPLSCM